MEFGFWNRIVVHDILLWTGNVVHGIGGLKQESSTWDWGFETGK